MAIDNLALTRAFNRSAKPTMVAACKREMRGNGNAADVSPYVLYRMIHLSEGVDKVNYLNTIMIPN